MLKELQAQPVYWLSLADCEKLFDAFKNSINFDEPLPPFDTRFPGKLEAILSSVQQTYSGVYLNDTVLDAASAYYNQINRGHAFQNGNKRLAVLFADAFLFIHGVRLTLTQKEMYALAMVIADTPEEIPEVAIKDAIKDVFQSVSRKQLPRTSRIGVD